ncbi:hypothetical protein [Vibrio crassostreae]|uniref:hypothetical protein n=1 Tax=Vibrio crassostreae TaxID=246167 RepID=UPI001043693A|nr:hypothetical protein [Vibrio crassostreae]TCT60142.1 hypothetical protein EDB31_15410 [Vibrio crassostreae]
MIGMDTLMGGAAGAMMPGGGGLSTSSSATATNGDFAGGASGVGGFTVNNGATAKENMTKYIVIGVVVIVAVFLWKK